MEISSQGANQGSWYVNPNTRTLTSNRKNTEIKDRDNFGCMQRLLNPVEDMIKVLKTPIKLADKTTVNRALGTVTIAEGTQIAVNDGYILTVRKGGVECRRADEYAPYDKKAYEKAQGLADSLAVLLRNAGGTQKTVAFSREGYEKWIDNVSTVLNYMGIDSSRSFTINGMKYSKNADGYWESAANSSAKAAYERALADNRIFTYADQRTLDQIDYISHCYPDGYAAYESANYRIEPDNENECFTIYNGQGERLGVFFYSDIKCRRDSSGKELLISEKGTMWYDALVLDQELKEDLRHAMGVDSLETEPLQGYSLKTHAGTGIQYLIRDGEEGRGGKVLLQSEADHEKYEALAETYLSKYPNLIESKDEAYIWASFEIRGMAARAEHGILSIHNDSMSYNDNSNFKNNWSIRFMDDVYQKIFEWLRRNGSHHEDMQKFSVWQRIFDDIGIDYERIWSKPEEEQGYLNN